MRIDTKSINKLANIKGNQVMAAMEAIGCIFGGSKNTGIVISLSVMVLPIIGFAIHEEVQKSEQKEKDRLHQEAILKQDGEIKALKIQADICNERQIYYREVLDAVLNSRRENDSDEQVQIFQN